jgi:hypothetical protein
MIENCNQELKEDEHLANELVQIDGACIQFLE